MREITANMNDGTTVCINYNDDDCKKFDGSIPGQTAFTNLSLEELKELSEAYGYFVKVATLLQENRSDL